MPEHDHEDEYRGEAVLFTEDTEISVEVVLRGNFQPIDGRFHWYGRLAEHQEITDLVEGRRTNVVLRTHSGEAVGKLSDPDPWNRYRITGVGRPPFAMESV